jgi:enoyl-CoA hydratase
MSRSSSVEKESPGVRLDFAGCHAHICFERRTDGPPVVTLRMMTELARLVERVAADPEVRSLTFVSEDPNVFLAGGDLKEFATLDTPRKGRTMALKMRGILDAIEDLPMPVIAAIQGDVYGGGCELILAADMRISVSDAQFSFSQGRFGLIPGWGGTTRLTRLVGPGHAMLLLATGRPVSAMEARCLALVDEVVANQGAFQDHISALHASMELLSPSALRAAKEAVRAAATMPADKSMDNELRLFGQLWASEEHREGQRAFFERRAPNWVGDDLK